jgi:hypothetical protein
VQLKHKVRRGIADTELGATSLQNTFFSAQGQSSITLYSKVIIIHFSLEGARDSIKYCPLFLVPTVNRL